MTIDVLVICTRNRYDDIYRCLPTVMKQRRMPARTLVVDSSDGEETAELVDKYRSEFGWESLDYVRTQPGLTLQRNVALDSVRSSADIVHFIDDDVELEPGYIEELMAAFENRASLSGAGGMVLGGNRRNPSMLARIGKRDSSRPGVVLSSGYNVGAHETPRDLLVDWLPGCSMSFKLDKISEIQFDERRTGYAIGEDVDFGLRAASVGGLLHVHKARLIHHTSPVNRHKRPLLVRMAVAHRWSLAEDGLGSVSKPWVVYGTLAEALKYLGQFIFSKRHDRTWWDCFLGDLEGLKDVLLRRRRAGHQ